MALTARKYCLLGFFFIISIRQSFTQNFQHSLGCSFQTLSVQPLEYLYVSNTQPAFLRKHQGESKYYGTLSYHIRRKVLTIDSSQFDLSVDLPLELSAYWTNDNSSGDNFANVSIPITLTANYGAYAFSNRKQKWPLGVFGGLGLLWQYTDGNLGNHNNWSPYIMTGIRVNLDSKYGLECGYAQNFFTSTYQAQGQGYEGNTPEFYQDKNIKLQSRTFSLRLIF